MCREWRLKSNEEIRKTLCNIPFHALEEVVRVRTSPKLVMEMVSSLRRGIELNHWPRVRLLFIDHGSFRDFTSRIGVVFFLLHCHGFRFRHCKNLEAAVRMRSSFDFTELRHCRQNVKAKPTWEWEWEWEWDCGSGSALWLFDNFPEELELIEVWNCFIFVFSFGYLFMELK